MYMYNSFDCTCILLVTVHVYFCIYPDIYMYELFLIQKLITTLKVIGHYPMQDKTLTVNVHCPIRYDDENSTCSN